MRVCGTSSGAHWEFPDADSDGVVDGVDHGGAFVYRILKCVKFNKSIFAFLRQHHCDAPSFTRLRLYGVSFIGRLVRSLPSRCQ